MIVRDWLVLAESALSGVESPKLEAQVLAAHALGMSRASLLAHQDAELPEFIDELLQRRANHEPLAYILGYREFSSRRFAVRPGVLIPRQETELLVETALRLAPQGGRVHEVGVGSGAVAITIALERPDLVVTGSDISPVAVSTARENAEALGASVEIREADGLHGLGVYDVIVCNPPYISLAERGALEAQVRDWEPPEALFSGPTGFEFYEMLAERAAAHLKPDGFIALELGIDQSEGVRALFNSHGWRFESLTNDLAGIPRVIAFQRGPS
ncbi:MAG: peptide chain release factor N(5)-glutamine methyltransferase [Armatimonadetes bacterium]|nr:peptide chain release factor N(5)-glutamine methyltransferase [Armatimonadota bacterium]